MLSPTPGTVLPGSTVTFRWNAGVNVERYALKVGTTVGGSDIYTEYSHTDLSRTVSGIPTDGRTIYVTLLSRIEGVWGGNQRYYTYTAKQ